MRQPGETCISNCAIMALEDIWIKEIFSFDSSLCGALEFFKRNARSVAMSLFFGESKSCLFSAETGIVI